METQPSCSVPGTSTSQNPIQDEKLMADLRRKLQEDPQAVERIRQFINQRQKEKGWFVFIKS